MKKLILPLFAVTLLTACSQSENAPELPVPIQLSSGIEITTKAPIASEGGKATASIGIWESKTTPGYTTAPTFQSTAEVTSATTAAAITLSPLRYYNSENNINSYIKGWYPTGTPSSGKVTFTNDDGQADAILSNEVSGSKNSKITTPLTFAHKTAQLIFKVVKGTGMDATTQIKSISVKGASVPTGFDLTKAPTDAGAVTWTAKSSLAVPSLTQATIGATAAVAGNPVMIQPVNDNTTVKLDVVTVVGGADVTFTDMELKTDNAKIEAGKAYTITLTFKQASIDLTAAITKWTEATGSGDIL